MPVPPLCPRLFPCREQAVPTDPPSARKFFSVRHFRLTALVLATALTPTAGFVPTAMAQQAAPRPGQPPITAQTQQSGGPRPAEQTALRLAHADLAFEVLPDRYALAGVATLTLVNGGDVALSRLLIDLDRNLPVSAITIDGRALRTGSWSNAEGLLQIPLARPLRSGARVVARITYGGQPHVAVRAPWDDGIVWSRTRDGKPWVGTSAQGYGCDLYWPCLDFPRGEPEVVDLHITVPRGLSAPANGRFISRQNHPDGRTTWNWRAISPNPYSISLNVAPYQEISGSYHSRFGNDIPLAFWHLPEHATQARRLFDEQFAPTISFFETLIGPYPWATEKLAIVETPYLGMEHQTINAYGADFAPSPDGFDTLFQHELAHEWFGNQMSAADWDDFWLHEGYAEYMQPLYGLWREGPARYAVMMEDMRRQIANRAPIVSGTSKDAESVYEEENGGPGNDIYMKGAWVLHTLRNLIGDAAFFDATRRLVYGRPDPAPGNFHPRFSSTTEFIGIVNQVTGRDYTWFFDVYLRKAALPELVETRTGDQLTLAWRAPDGLPFPMPVEVSVNDVVQRVEMPDGRAVLTVPADAHVVVDPWEKILRRSPALEEWRQRHRR